MAGSHPLACALHRGPWHGLTPSTHPTRGEFHLMETRPELGEKKKSANGCGVLHQGKSLKIGRRLLNKPPPKLNFQKKCRKNHVISSFLYLPATFCQCFGLFVVWFPLGLPNIWRSNCPSTDLENSKSTWKTWRKTSAKKRGAGSTQECGNDDIGTKKWQVRPDVPRI